MPENLMYGALFLIIISVLVLPFISKKVEQNLEAFLFIMGLLAVLISKGLNTELVLKALEEPFMISAAVLIAGILFQRFREKINRAISSIQQRISTRLLLFLIVTVLGLVSSLITAIIAALILVEVVTVLKLDRKSEVAIVIITCFAIGLGAALTPVGEPLATIVISKLEVDFWYLARTLGAFILPAILGLGFFAAFFIRPNPSESGLSESERGERFKEVVIRALKVYLFVMALVFLGTGLKPLIDRFVLGLPSQILYWLNMISAILDNATLAAAEISDKMTKQQIIAIMMGLLISGGMLIPGNIPNIISASKLNIQSKEWARLGFPLGLVIMLLFYVIIFYMI
ncbi:DUF1646 family protein [Desulfitobacterium sp. Sab5]|uniref:DUF1646 family protein n=1 Tax=Desulfitobacterium nosdiversum TaxID=3375356 RepID=UPI003CED2E51